MLVVLVEPINGILLALEAFSLFSIPVGACGAETTLPREAEEAKSKARGDATESLVDCPSIRDHAGGKCPSSFPQPRVGLTFGESRFNKCSSFENINNDDL